MSRVLILVVLVAVLVLGASVGYFNAQLVRFDYLFGVRELPLIGVLILAFALGVVLALLVVAGRILGLRLELRRLRGQLRDRDAELRSLRNLPLPGGPSGEAKP